MDTNSDCYSFDAYSDNSDIIKQGYAKQKIRSGFLYDKTKKYYLVLSKHNLNKYESEKSNVAIENYNLYDYMVIDGSFISQKKNTLLLINKSTNDKISYIFENESEYRDWFNILNKISNHKSNEKLESDIIGLESILEPCVISDNFGLIKGFNKGAEKLFGYSKNEILDKNISILMPPNYSKIHDHIMEQYRKNGQTKLIGKPRSLPIKKKDNSTINVTISLSQYKNKKTNRDIFIAIFKNLEEEQIKINSENKLVRWESNVSSSASSDSNDSMDSLECIENQKQKISNLEEYCQMLQNKLVELYKQNEKLQNELNEAYFNNNIMNLLKILENEVAFKIFLEYSKTKKSEENVLFLKDVKEMKNKYMEHKNIHHLKNNVREIFDKYISKTSRYHLNINTDLIDHISNKLENNNICPSIFDVIFKDILKLTYDNIFMYFISTGLGKITLSNIYL